MEDHHAARVGAAALLCALILRLFSSGLPEKCLTFLLRPDTMAFLTYLETGRDVRFSEVLEAFSPDFVESPPAATTEPLLPAFSGEEGVEVYYACQKEADIPALLSQSLSWNLYGEEPTVLILHTHATESYTKKGEDYEESAQYRTLDEDYNMLSLGAFVADALTEAGIPTLQDRTLHDSPAYNGAYTRSRKTIQSYLAQYPSIQLVLDLHRDAVEVSYGQLHTRCDIGEDTAAQLMVVLGTNYDTWQDNLSLALKLHAQLERQAQGLTRPLQLRSQRFNQDLSPGCLLIEIGAAGNTHTEALRAAQELVDAILALAGGTVNEKETIVYADMR